MVSDSEAVQKEYEKGAVYSKTLTKFYRISEAIGKELFSELKGKPGVVLLKDYGEDKEIYKPLLEKKKFKLLLKENLIPAISPVNKETLELFLKHDGLKKKGVILFRKEIDSHMDDTFKELRKLYPSKEYVFALSTSEPRDDLFFGHHIKVGAAEFPVLVIAYYDGKEPKRFYYRGNMDITSMDIFMKKWLEGRAVREYASDAITGPNPGPVFTAVSRSFKQDVIESAIDVIVKFYSPKCKYCGILLPIYEELAKSYVGDKTIKFMEVDATKNEVEGHFIEVYPTVMFFPAKDKSHPILARDVDKASLSKFIQEHHITTSSEKPKTDL